jgi:hypothetical protein
LFTGRHRHRGNVDPAHDAGHSIVTTKEGEMFCGCGELVYVWEHGAWLLYWLEVLGAECNRLQ